MSRVLHAGFHKTGSTYLQKEFFPKLNNTIFVKTLDLGHLPICQNEDINIIFSNEASCG